MPVPGSNNPPYRASCAGTVKCGNGPRYRNARASEKNIPVWLYDAQVPNWDGCAGQPANIDPYERPNPTFIDPATDNCGGGDATYTQPGGPWYGNCFVDDVATACGPTTTPASGSGQEVFDLANPAPVMWYQPQTLTAVTVVSGGAGYEVGDTLGLNGGAISSFSPPYWESFDNNASLLVTAVDGSGAITALSIAGAGSYKTNPSSPNAVTGGHGSGASITLTFGNQMMSLAQCRKIGFKNVQARRQWHGQPGYFFQGDYDTFVCPSDNDEAPLCNYAPFIQFSNSAGDTKYTTFTATAAYTAYQDGEEVCSGEQDINLSVNPHSGVITNTSSAFGDPGQCCAFTTSFAEVPFAEDLVAMLTNSVMDWWDYFWTDVYAGPQSFSDVITCGDGSFTDQFYDDGTHELTGVSDTLTWSFGAGSFAISFTQVNEGVTTLFYSLSITDNSLSFSATLYDVEDIPVYASSTLSISLGGPNTAADVLGDAETLLGEWNLTDDAEYPWRIDANTSMAPLVSRNEVPTNVSPLNIEYLVPGTTPDSCTEPCFSGGFAYDMVASTDANALIYDGSILGAPMPAGYQGFYDFRWQDFQNAGDIGGLPDYEIFGWGAKANGLYGIPFNATQWTNVQEGIQFPGGAWIFYNLNPSVAGNGDCFGPGAGCPTPAPVLMVQKWAETKVPFPGQNFARPAGNDRFAFDETQVFAVSSITGSGPGAIVDLVDTIHCSTPVIDGFTGLWGGPIVGGFYEVTGSGSSMTLGTLVYPISTDWASASGDSAACFGKLRWATGNPATDPPPILGRAGVSAVAEYMSNPSVTELTTDFLPNMGIIEAAFGNDAVDIYDSHMNLLASDAAVTRIDDTHFTVPVAVATIEAAAWIQSHGSPAYYWDDQFPKGDFVYTDWTYWPRQVYEPGRINTVYDDCAAELCGTDPTSGCDCSSITCETPAANVLSGFTQEAGCVGFNPCNPSVLCISPSGENFPNGVTYGFADIDLDELYGSGWQADFQQVMADLFWQPPHVPASSPCASEVTAWTEDDGSCEGDTDTNTFYPHRPLVEARLTVPAGAPALPSGITIGWASPVTDPSSREALFPAPSNGPGLGGPVPWSIWQDECNCISAEGRFAETYENQVVDC